jgi:taurine dioxygenase
MQIEPASPLIGAIVTGLDLNRITATEWQTLYQTWLERQVLVVRGQEFTIPQFLAVAERFGRLMPHRVLRTRHPEYPALTQMGVGTRKADGQVDQSILARGQGWHTDGPWEVRGVAKATQLYGLEIPSIGGDTWFANMYTAYDALPEALRQRLEGVQAEYVYGGRERKGVDLLDPADRDAPPVLWPVLRTHPETGRRSLYFNPTHFLRFVGMADAEGDALAAELFDRHMIRPEAEYHHKWQRHDYVIWDNRCSNHAAAGGYPIEEPRVHWRATILE